MNTPLNYMKSGPVWGPIQRDLDDKVKAIMSHPLKTALTIIRDSRDATLDYKLPRKRAEELYIAGKLCIDRESGRYMHKELHQPKFTWE